MKHFTNLLTKLVSVVVLCFLFAGGAWADKATFDFCSTDGLNALGVAAPATSAGTNLKDLSIKDGAISFSCTDGGTATRVWNYNGAYTLRVYKKGNGSNSQDGSITFTADEGYIITSITGGITADKVNKQTYTIAYSANATISNSITVNYTSTTSPSIGVSSASVSLDGVDANAASDTKSLTVTPANLTEGISYALAEGENSPFAVTGTLSQTKASDLTIALKSTATKGYYTDVLTITSGTISQPVTLNAFVNGNFTVAELTAAANNLAANEQSAYDYTIVGYIKEITTAWSTQYNNISFTIADEKTGEETFLVFRASAGEGTAGEDLLAGDKVSVTGKLVNYNGKTPEFATGCVVTLIESDTKNTRIFVDEEKAVFVGKTVELGATVNSGATLTYASSDTEVATVDAAGVVTGIAAGTATITVTAPAYDGWPTASAEVTISVTEAPNYIFYESFDKNDGKGGNDDSWSGSIAANNIQYDNTGWTCENEKGADKCAKFGSTSKKGSAQTPKLSLIEGTVNCKLTFKAAAWASDGTTLNLSINGDGTLDKNSVELLNSGWTDYTIYITGATANTQIKFEAANASNNRFFLDEVLVKEADWETISISAAGFSTLYYDEKNLVVPEGVVAHTIYSDGEVIIFNYDYKAGEVIPAGNGVVLEGAAGSYIFEATTEDGLEDDENMLRGSDADASTAVEGDAEGTKYYKLSTKNSANVGFYWGAENGAAFTNGAHKAYLVLDVTGNSKSAFVFGDITGIATATTAAKAEKVVYDLQGRKVTNPKRGLYIVNGKVVSIK